MRLTQVVVSGLPFHCTTELDSLFTKSVPFTVRVKPPLPARTGPGGDIELRVGTGNRQVPKHWAEMLYLPVFRLEQSRTSRV
jgi:hypothetical protein